MRDKELYAVTGASGRTGSAVARTLLEAGKRVRVIVRDITKGEFWKNQGAEVGVADNNNVSELIDALSGVHAAYVVSPQQYTSDDLFAQADAMALAIAQAASAAKLTRLVALSSVGADKQNGTGWIAMNRVLEQRLIQAGLPVAFLRAAYFMENWTPMASVALEKGVLPSFLSPLDQKISMVATADVGRIAAEVLCENWSEVRTINIEGPVAYSPNEVAEAFSRILHKPVHSALVPELDWGKILSNQGFSIAAIAGFTEMTQGLNNGHISFAHDCGVEHRKGVTNIDTIVSMLVTTL